MKTKRMWAGLDVSKDEIAVALWPGGQGWTCPRSEQALAGLAEELRRLRVRLVALEATGGLEVPVVLALARRGVPIHRCEPSRARHFAKALGVRAKTDRVDAVLLARFAASGELKPQTFASDAVRELDALVTRRRQLVDLITVESNRLKSSAAKACRESARHVLKVLLRERRALETQIAAALDAAPELRAKADLLQSAPGVGKVTAATLTAALPELGTLNRWQVASLTGTAPYANQSGRFRGQTRIFGGRADVRCALYMAVLAGMRHHPWMRALYEHHLARGKKKKVALVACMRRLVVVLNAMVRDNAAWRPAAA